MEPTPSSFVADPADRPTVRLTPRADARALRWGYPWVYDSDVVMDRRARKLAPGTLAVLEDAKRAALGLVAVTPASKITLRMIDRDPDATVDVDWFAARITRALAHRARLYDAPFYRLIHAEADGLPGVIVDRFGDLVVVQPNAAWADARIADLAEALLRIEGVTRVWKSGAGRARGLEGLDDVSMPLAGTAPDGPIPVEMNGATYMADITGGQKTGLFFDQRENHRFAARLSRNADVLDVFSHVGGFALAALAGGAASAFCVDGSAPALALAEDGAKAMGAGDLLTVRQGDAFETLTALAEEGRSFGVVICDPPAFAPSKKALEAGLRAYEKIARLAAPLVREGGYLGLCSCSHAVDLPAFRSACLRGIGRGGRQPGIIHTGHAGPDHPVMGQLAETGYLKALFFRL